jgi:hypothetical protein
MAQPLCSRRNFFWYLGGLAGVSCSRKEMIIYVKEALFSLLMSDLAYPAFPSPKYGKKTCRIRSWSQNSLQSRIRIRRRKKSWIHNTASLAVTQTGFLYNVKYNFLKNNLLYVCYGQYLNQCFFFFLNRNRSFLTRVVEPDRNRNMLIQLCI